MSKNLDTHPEKYCSPMCTSHFNATNDPWFIYEDTDHVTLYPYYEYDTVDVTFDPTGGYFNKYSNVNTSYVFDESGESFQYGFLGIARPLGGTNGGCPYGWFTVPGLKDPEDDLPGYGNVNPLPEVTRDYYELDGWYYKDDDGKEQEFTLATIVPHDLDVYAKWKPGKSKVWYIAGASSGGFIPDDEMDACGLDSSRIYEVPTESTIAEAGKRFPIPSNKDGRKFLGWVTYDDEPFTENMPVIGTVELYAQWGALPKDLPINLDFDPNGGTFDDETFENNISGNRGTSFNTFPSVSRDDYDFLGWYVLKPGATDYNDDASYIQMVGKTLSIKNDMVDDLGDDDDNNDKVTLVARWQPKAHAQSITMLGYNTSTYKTNPVENGESFELQYDTTGEFLYQFRATVLPETVDNREVIWSSSDPNIVYISGANADGEYVTRNNAYLTRLKFADGLTPTREGYDVTLTARSADVASVTFTIPLHITFPEDQIPVTVTFDAGEHGLFQDADTGIGYQNKVYDVKRSQVLLGVKGLKEPTPKDAKKYEFIGWKVVDSDGEDVCDVTADMKASDLNWLDEIRVVAK